MNIFIAETKPSFGHVNLYNRVIPKISEGEQCVFLSGDRMNDLIVLPSNVTRGPSLRILWGNRGKIRYNVEQVYLVLKVFLIAKRQRADKLIFLSYDTFAVGVLSLLLIVLRIKQRPRISVVEHNNLDQLSSNYTKKVLYRLSSKVVASIVFCDYIGAHVKKNYDRNYAVVSHPETSFKQSRSLLRDSSSPYVFLPSSDVDVGKVNKVFDYCREENLRLVCKKHVARLAPADISVTSERYFEDYEEVFLGAEAVVIASDFKYRVSGVFFECLGNNKRVLMTDCLFSRQVYQRYANRNLIEIL